MRTCLPFLAAVTLLGSCASPPKPPTVDESRRHPVNAAAQVELQTCKTELQGSRILLKETTRLAERANAAATRLTLERQAIAAQPPADIAMANTVHTIRFGFGSSEVAIPTSEAESLLEQVRSAPLVLLRARTDGQVDAASESRIARERALSVRHYLVQAGADPARIRMTWQPVGDTVADNGTAGGRALNRRVEIEIYRFTPRNLDASTRTAALQP